jgi:hypothetical protein
MIPSFTIALLPSIRISIRRDLAVRFLEGAAVSARHPHHVRNAGVSVTNAGREHA